MKATLTIRDLLWAVALSAIVTCWWHERTTERAAHGRTQKELQFQLDDALDEVAYLANVIDEMGGKVVPRSPGMNRTGVRDSEV